MPEAWREAALIAAQVAAVAIGVALLRRSVLLSAPTRDGLLLAGLAFALQPFWVLIGSNESAGLSLALLAGAVAAGTSGRALLAGGFIGALLALDPGAAIVLAVAFIAASPKRAAASAGLVIAAGVLLGIDAFARPAVFAERLSELLPAPGDATLWSLSALVPGPTGLALSGAIAVTAVASVIVWWRSTRPLFDTVVAVCTCLSLTIAPRASTVDHLLLLVPVAVVIELLARRLSGRRALGLAALAIAIGVLPWLLYLVDARVGTEAPSAAIPLICLAFVLAVDRQTRSARSLSIEGEGAIRIG